MPRAPQLLTVLPKLIRAGRGNCWTTFEKMAVYVRVGPKVVEETREYLVCVQLANLSLPPKLHRRGTFARLVTAVQDLTDLPIYVEQVLNPSFLAALLRRGFRPARSYEGCIYDVYLRKEPTHAPILGE